MLLSDGESSRLQIKTFQKYCSSKQLKVIISLCYIQIYLVRLNYSYFNANKIKNNCKGSYNSRNSNDWLDRSSPSFSDYLLHYK